MAKLNNYGDDSIKQMEEMEHIRSRPGVYGFVPDTIQGNLMQLKETLDNSVDEALDPDHRYEIDVTFFVKGNEYQVVIRDHGRGVPINKLKDVFTKLFTSGKYEDGSYEATVGTNGMGSKVTAALSKRLVAITKRPDGFGYLEVKKGITTDLYVQNKRIDTDNRSNGTVVFFEPDPEILKVTNEFISSGGIEEHINLVKFTTAFSKNITIVVRKVNKLIPASFFKQEKYEIWKQLTEHQGTVLFSGDETMTPRRYVQELFGLNKNVIWELGDLSKEQRTENQEDRLGYDIDIFMDDASIRGKRGIIAAINRTPISLKEASHVRVLMMVLKQYLVEFIEDKDMVAFFEMNYELPISGSIMAKWRRATFEGQDKHNFRDREFEASYRSALRKQLGRKPQGFWEHFYELIEEDVIERYNKYTNRNLRIGHGLKGISALLNNVKSYNNCISTDKNMTELFIVEGDSAGGVIKIARDEKYQAIFKLRGKPLNVIKKGSAQMDENLIYQDLVRLLGVGPKDKTLDSMNFSKIIITTDADTDGAHIVSIAVGALYKINPLILEQGRVYLANPPLYGVRTKNSRIYLRDQKAMDDCRIDNLYRELIDIELEVGKNCERITGDVYMSLCRAVMRIGRVVSNVSKTLNVEPIMIEQLLHVVQYLEPGKVNAAKVKEILGVHDAFYKKETNTLFLVEDDMEFAIPIDRLAIELKAYVLPEYETLMWKKFNLYATTRHSDLYYHTPTTPMRLYRDFQILDSIFTVTRYKGLGEMKSADLKYTCLDPATRCLTRITSVGSVEKIYAILGVKSDARKKLVLSGYADELDDATV